VAVKVLHDAACVDRETRERFAAEARLTASISDPHVVTVIDYGAATGVPWIAYELLPGRTLRDRLSDGPVPWREALAIGAQVAGALEAAHGHSIVHRDIKAENVLEAVEGHYKVADFGIAKWSGAGSVRTAAGIVMGTPSHLAPELIRGEPPTPSSDVYALGVLLYRRPLCIGLRTSGGTRNPPRHP
jgi:serine/threonine protein kinase